MYATDNEQPYSQFDSQSGSFHLSRQVSENLKFDFLSLGSKSNVNYPGNVKSFSYPIEGQFQEIEEILLSPGVQIKIEDWKVKAFYSFSEDNLIGKDSFSDTTYDADTNALDFQVNGAVTDGVEIVLGGSYEEESFYKKIQQILSISIKRLIQKAFLPFRHFLMAKISLCFGRPS